ncbi:MAG: asparagine synthase (glutamine-hydrolyzing) [Candidatus Binatia bacterium]
MCGICGVLSLDGNPVTEAVVEAMVGSLDHRGPDGSAVYVKNRVGLGHTRLKVIDLSPAAQQPMSNEDGTLGIVFNGEIYNYRELKGSLKSLGHAFRSQSDTEVILHLYEEKGDCCVEELDGMFAFALWDLRRLRLLLARDRVGKKPLFYYSNTKLFAFASEIKALFRHPSVPADVDQSMVPSYFIYGYVPTPATFYQGISSLPAGHSLIVTPEGTQQKRPYWDLSFLPDGVCGSTFTNERQAASRVRDLVTDAVRKRLFADVSLGAFLSGGIDSTIVVGIMSHLMKEPVKTFSIGFEGDPAFDETRYSRIVAHYFKADHTEFVVRPRAIDLIETLIWHHDGPFGDSSGIPAYIVSRLTKEHVTVALNGDGGDELFAGYSRFYGGIIADRIPSSIMQCANSVLSFFPEPDNYYHPLRKAQRFFRGAGSPFYERYSRWISLFYDDLEALLSKDLLVGRVETDRIAYFRGYLEKVSQYTPLSRLLYLNFKTYLLDDLLVKMDRMTMAHGLEVRSPFLDRGLIEYAATLPDSMKLRWGGTKYILRRAFSDLLPTEVLTRGKMGFGVPLGAWFRGELRDYIQDLLLAPDARIRGYLNQGYVKKVIHEHVHTGRDHGLRLWAILAFEVWLRLLSGWVTGPQALFPSISPSLSERPSSWTNGVGCK